MLGCSSKCAAKWHSNITMLKNEDKSQFLSKLKDFLGFILGLVNDSRNLWNAVKDFIRSNTLLCLKLTQGQQIESQREVVKKKINNFLKQGSEFLVQRTK